MGLGFELAASDLEPLDSRWECEPRSQLIPLFVEVDRVKGEMRVLLRSAGGGLADGRPGRPVWLDRFL